MVSPETKLIAQSGHTNTESSAEFYLALQNRAKVADDIWHMTGEQLIEAALKGESVEVGEVHARAAQEITELTGIPQVPIVITPPGTQY